MSLNPTYLLRAIALVGSMACSGTHAANSDLSGTYRGTLYGNEYAVTFSEGHTVRMLIPAGEGLGQTVEGTYLIEQGVIHADFGSGKITYGIIDERTLHTSYGNDPVNLVKQ